LQYLFEMRSPELPQPIAAAQASFEADMAMIVQAMSDEVAGKASSIAPDIQESAATLRQEIQKHYSSGSPLPPQQADIITLTQNLAAILAPLYLDIHATFTDPQQMEIHHPQIELRKA
jgi:hypothetical protein